MFFSCIDIVSPTFFGWTFWLTVERIDFHSSRDLEVIYSEANDAAHEPKMAESVQSKSLKE